MAGTKVRLIIICSVLLVSTITIHGQIVDPYERAQLRRSRESYEKSQEYQEQKRREFDKRQVERRRADLERKKQLKEQLQQYKYEKGALPRLDSQVKTLQRRVTKLESIVKKLENHIASLEKKLAKKDIPTNQTALVPGMTEVTIVGGFYAHNVRLDYYPARNAAVIIGEITNNSKKKYTTATFVVTVYDRDGRILSMQPFTTGNFEKGQAKSFATTIEAVFSPIHSYKIDYEGEL